MKFHYAKPGASWVAARDLAEFKRRKLSRDPHAPLRRVNLPQDLSREISLAYLFRSLLFSAKK